ncbi:hypothetical protein TorRG33x02_212670, partial [Trema orientale]
SVELYWCSIALFMVPVPLESSKLCRQPPRAHRSPSSPTRSPERSASCQRRSTAGHRPCSRRPATWRSYGSRG